MNLKYWLKKLFPGVLRTTRPSKFRRNRPSVRPWVETLEDRVVPAALTIIASENWSAITGGTGTGGLPSSTDSVLITNGAVVTVDGTGTTDIAGAITLGSSTISPGTGELLFNSGTTLTVATTLTSGATAADFGKVDMTSGGTLNFTDVTPTPWLLTVGANSFTVGTGTVEYSGAGAVGGGVRL